MCFGELTAEQGSVKMASGNTDTCLSYKYYVGSIHRMVHKYWSIKVIRYVQCYDIKFLILKLRFKLHYLQLNVKNDRFLALWLLHVPIGLRLK